MTWFSTDANAGKQAAHAFAEFLRLRQQAQDQEGFRLKVVEKSRLDQDPVLVEKLQAPFFLRSGPRHAQDGVPASFDFQRAAGRIRAGGGLEEGEILSRARC